MAKKRDKETNLSERFNSLIQARPNFYDEDEEDLTKIDDVAAKDENSDYSADELDLVQFRKLNIEFLDAEDNKYSGKKSSRVEQSKAFDSDSSDPEVSSDENVDCSNSVRDDGFDGSGGDVEDVYYDDEDDDSCSAKIDRDQGFPEVAVSREEPGKVENEVLNEEMLQKSAEDILKGNAIRNQLLIWDLLLECRMKFQKCLISSNQLPNFQKLKKFASFGGAEFDNLLATSQDSLKRLLNSLLEVQEFLLVKNEDYRNCSQKHRISSDEDECDDQECNSASSSSTRLQKKRLKLSEFSHEIEDRHKKMETFRNETIQKWNDKTRVAHLNSKNFNAFEQSTVKQIEQVLLDKPRLIKRTQVKRSNYHILGQSDDEDCPPKKLSKVDEPDKTVDCGEKKNEKKINKEIFDDDDFYHQLLSEYVKRKSFDVSDPIELSKQWIQLEKIRSKMKKKVDTRATKGRKIRYVVHQKLVNFMMPIDNVLCNEGSRIELFNSIFGKNQNL